MRLNRCMTLRGSIFTHGSVRRTGMALLAVGTVITQQATLALEAVVAACRDGCCGCCGTIRREFGDN